MIERLSGGDYNRITGITLPPSYGMEGRELIVRTPRGDEGRQERDLAILSYVRQWTSIPVPTIAAKDFSCDNPLGTQVANISSNTNTGTMVVTTAQQKNPAELLYISLAFGFSLAVNAWVFFPISGGLFNPAVSDTTFTEYLSNDPLMGRVDNDKRDMASPQVTLDMVLIGAITWVRGILLFIIQVVGGIVAAEIVQALFQGDLAVSTTLG
ncbi:hypothetical protein OEA41_001612 [Lepraria neglecta]|uniref:Uncharacterized protein n=1 Tax=Lepraria neglecta TaxID=209136 RepID=A0AAD9ZAZ0_9LECA|nr:hypothetical protein OEA41_001612 [Lepraria neglecta]